MPGFLKRYGHAGLAAEALRRAVVLRRQGVPTPAATPGPEVETLVFDRIEGRSGLALLDGAPELALLPVVRGLHGASVPGLPPHDPLRRIRPRLELTDVAILREIAHGRVPSGRAVLHGDLHLGQFIKDPAGAVWLVDLDDMALGPPEADLANFAAHLATTDPGPGVAEWVARVCHGWSTCGAPLDREVFARFLGFALLRRHLKLRAAGRPDFEAEILAYLRDSASFSMR